MAKTAVSIFLCLFIVSCSSEPSVEEQAKAVYEKGLELESKGEEIEAMKEFNRLAEFKDSEFYAEAELKLRERGISIGSALESWTLKKMQVIRNDMIRLGQEHHPEGDTTVPILQKDAWGTKFWVEYSSDPRYTFALISAGPDKVFKTDDDLALFRKVPGANKTDSSALEALQEYAKGNKPEDSEMDSDKKNKNSAGKPAVAEPPPQFGVTKEDLGTKPPSYEQPPENKEEASSDSDQADRFPKLPKPNSNGETTIELEDLLKNN